MIAMVSGGDFEKGKNGGWCHLARDFEIGVWILPLILTMLWNFIFYILILYIAFSVLRKIKAPSQIKMRLIRKLSFLLLVFLLCWVFDLYNHMSTYFFNAEPPEWMYYLQDFFSPSQGFFNAIIYGLTNQEFKKAFTSCMRRRNSSFKYERIQTLDDA